MSRWTVTLAALFTAIACSGSTTPPTLGGLKQEIIAGRLQTSVAAPNTPSAAIVDFVYRERLALAPTPSTFERLLLPSYAYAQTSKSVLAQPNSVVCVGEDQTDLIPFARCVTTDALGQSRFDFPRLPTKSGTYRARFNAVYGLEASTLDSVVITVTPARLDSNYRMQGIPSQQSPAVFPGDGVRDIYGNGLPYRIVSDGRLTVLDTVVGSVGARTVTFGQAQVAGRRYTAELRGTGDVLVGRMSYHIGLSSGVPIISFTACGVKVDITGC